jgi:hypothetical protein
LATTTRPRSRGSATLAAALAAKKSATWAHVEATVAYYASTKTRKNTARRVKARYSKKVWGNNDNNDKVEVDTTTKKDLSDSYLAKEENKSGAGGGGENAAGDGAAVTAAAAIEGGEDGSAGGGVAWR